MVFQNGFLFLGEWFWKKC